MVNINFEIEIKSALIKKRKTISSLAKQMGVSTAYLSDLIRGNRKSIKQRKKLCELLEIEFTEEMKGQ